MNSWHDEFGDVLTGQRVLVTGASGFVGVHLCDALIALGAEVHGLSRSYPAQGEFPGCCWWSVDLTQADAVRSTLQKVQPQVVFHLAGLVTGRQDVNLVLPMLHANLISTVHLMLSLTPTDCRRFVLVGSSEELGTDNGVPGSPYAASKMAASSFAQMFWRLYDLPVVIAQLFMGYGSRQSPDKLVPYLIRSALAGQPPHVSSGERICDLIYVTDIIRGLIGMACRTGLEGQIIQLGSGQGVTVSEVAELIMELSNSSVAPMLAARPNRLGEHAHVADLSAARCYLQWEPRWSLRDGLLATIAWHQIDLERATDVK